MLLHSDTSFFPQTLFLLPKQLDWKRELQLKKLPLWFPGGPPKPPSKCHGRAECPCVGHACSLSRDALGISPGSSEGPDDVEIPVKEGLFQCTYSCVMFLNLDFGSLFL